MIEIHLLDYHFCNIRSTKSDHYGHNYFFHMSRKIPRIVFPFVFIFALPSSGPKAPIRGYFHLQTIVFIIIVCRRPFPNVVGSEPITDC